VLQQVEVPASAVEHFQSESKRPDLVVEKPGTNWQIVATGVEFIKNS
jgi:hypothetical protein